MLENEQIDRLRDLMKPDVVIDLGKTVATPFDLLQLQAQLEAIKAQPELLALHYSKLGEIAIEKSAYDEAVTHLDNALKLLDELPITLERAKFELELRIARGTAVKALKEAKALLNKWS